MHGGGLHARDKSVTCLRTLGRVNYTAHHTCHTSLAGEACSESGSACIRANLLIVQRVMHGSAGQ
eukprot:4283132-Prymnesium_polylepis.2